MIVQPDPAHPGHRRGRLRDPPVRGAAPRATRWSRSLLYPGLLVQMITTKQPTDDMIEVAIVSMEQALEADGETVPDGLGDVRARPDACSGRRRDARRSAAGSGQRPPPAAHRPTRRRGRERPRRQAGGGRPPVRRRPGRAGTPGDRRPTRPSSAGSARSWPASSRSSRRSAGSRRPATELAGARELRDAGDADDELRAMAREEIDRLEADETRLLEELKVLLLPRDPNDDRDVILEIRAGAGGEEAALFAAELLPDVPPLRRAPPLHARGAEPQRDRHRRHQGGDRPDPRRRRLQPAQVRGRRPSRPARPGDRVVRAHPHLDRDRHRACPRPTRSRSQIDEERDLRIDVKRSSGPGGQSRQHDRLRRAHHPPADAAWSSRSRTRRASTRTRPRRCPCCARGCYDLRAAEAARGRFGGAPVDGRRRATARRRSGPTTSRRTG